MFDFIIRRARLADQSLTDIAIRDGRIMAIGNITGPAHSEQDLAGRYYISAGWIDSHVHCYPKSPIYHDDADHIGVKTGVTTVIDAGSTGANDIDDFRDLTQRKATQVYALLNIARTGIATQDELADLQQIDTVAACAAVQRHPDFIVGLKARMSSSVVGDNGIQPLLQAKNIQQMSGHLPLMVHVGNTPPDVDDIASHLTSGDILTHCFNGKPNRILTSAGTLRASIQAALQRGVLLDVGYGTASFSFAVARQAIAQGILPNTISSDIYCRNRIHGPVHRLAHIMSAFLSMGMTLSQVIDCVTSNAAKALRLASKGQLSPGFDADLTVFSVKEGSCSFWDADGVCRQGQKELIPLAVMVAGQWILTDEGKNSHVFCL